MRPRPRAADRRRASPRPATAAAEDLTIYSSLPLRGDSRAQSQDVVRGEQLALEQAGGAPARTRSDSSRSTTPPPLAQVGAERGAANAARRAGPDHDRLPRRVQLRRDGDLAPDPQRGRDPPGLAVNGHVGPHAAGGGRAPASRTSTTRPETAPTAASRPPTTSRRRDRRATPRACVSACSSSTTSRSTAKGSPTGHAARRTGIRVVGHLQQARARSPAVGAPRPRRHGLRRHRRATPRGCGAVHRDPRWRALRPRRRDRRAFTRRLARAAARALITNPLDPAPTPRPSRSTPRSRPASPGARAVRDLRLRGDERRARRDRTAGRPRGGQCVLRHPRPRLGPRPLLDRPQRRQHPDYGVLKGTRRTRAGLRPDHLP